MLNELAFRLVLCYTGTSPYSNDIIERQTKGYTTGRSETVEALDQTKQPALEMKDALLHGHVVEMGELLHRGWELKKQFAEGITNHQIDRFYEKARRAGALGGKLAGAEGGGYLLLFCDPAQRADGLRAVCESGGSVTDFGLEHSGLQSSAANRES